MAATLTPMELLAQEIGFMDEKRKSMDASIKASEARLKDIRAKYDVAEIKVKQDLEQLELTQEKKRAALLDLVGPLDGQVEALRNKVAAEEKKLEAIKTESLTMLDERRKQLAILDEAIKTKQDRLALMADDLNKLKAKVSAL